MLNETKLFKDKKYVVGVSGGPDSMALLDMLRKEGYSLMVCMVNYHKRNDSDLDYDVVKRFCHTYHIPLAYKEVFVYDKGNFQAQARTLRYDFYVEVAKLYHLDAVVLAHHLDDYLETVLMQQERHQEDGLWGIQNQSHYQGLDVIRPLLHCTKVQLVDYCHQNAIDYRIDSSNLENDYRRNYFRNEVLNNYTKEQKEALYKEALNHNEAVLKRNQFCDQWLNKHVTDQHFSLQTLWECAYPSSVLKAFLMAYTEIPSTKLSKKMIENALSALKKEGNVTIHLPVNFVLIKEYDNVYVTKLTKEESFCFQVNDFDIHDFGYFQIRHQGPDRCGISLKEGDLPLTIRSFKQGDTICLSYGHKKLSRLFIDAKIPRHLRQKWPVVLNSKGEIVLVPKIGKNKDYLLAKPTWFVIQ